MFPSLSLFSLFSHNLCSNTAASLLPHLSISPRLSSICVSSLPSCRLPSPIPPSPRRASPSWPSRGTSWGPTQPSSPRTTRTPARMQPEPLTPPSVGRTWRVQEQEGSRPTAKGPLTAPEATSVRTTEILGGNILVGEDLRLGIL